MKITPDRLAVARAVREQIESRVAEYPRKGLLLSDIRHMNLDAIIASVPAPDVQALRGQIEGEVWEARKRVEAALSAEIVELRAQIDAPPAGYADRAFTDAEWAMRYAEKCRERDDALAARDECAPLCEKHRADEQWRGLTDCLACATEELEARVTEFDSQIDTAREQLSAREQSATNLAALAADPDNEGLHTAPMMTPDWTTRDLLRTYWREHVKDQKQLIYLARVATGADTHGVTELDRRGMEIRDALLRGYEQNEDLCFLDEVRHENERLKAQIDAARARSATRSSTPSVASTARPSTAAQCLTCCESLPPAAARKESDMEELFRRLVEKGGCIVSSADCHQIEIADARVRGDWWVDENGMGFVLRLPEWLARHSMDARGANSDTCEIRARSGAKGA